MKWQHFEHWEQLYIAEEQGRHFLGLNSLWFGGVSMVASFSRLSLFWALLESWNCSPYSMYHCQFPGHIMTWPNVLPIMPYEAVYPLPWFLTCPLVMNCCDIGVLVDIWPENLGFTRDLVHSKLVYTNGHKHVHLHCCSLLFLWIFTIESDPRAHWWWFPLGMLVKSYKVSNTNTMAILPFIKLNMLSNCQYKK